MRQRLIEPAVDREAGATAAELLAAAAVIGVGLLALVAVIPVASHSVQEGAQVSTAVFLASQRLEQVRSGRWEGGGATPVDEVGVSAPATASPSASGATTFPDEAPMPPPHGHYSRRVRIVDCATGAGCAGIVSPALRHVTVEVEYRPLTATGVAAPAERTGAVLAMYLSRR